MLYPRMYHSENKNHHRKFQGVHMKIHPIVTSNLKLLSITSVMSKVLMIYIEERKILNRFVMNNEMNARLERTKRLQVWRRVL